MLIVTTIFAVVLYIGILVFFIVTCVFIGAGSNLYGFEVFIHILMFLGVLGLWIAAILYCWQFIMAVNSYKIVKGMVESAKDESGDFEMRDND